MSGEIILGKNISREEVLSSLTSEQTSSGVTSVISSTDVEKLADAIKASNTVSIDTPITVTTSPGSPIELTGFDFSLLNDKALDLSATVTSMPTDYFGNTMLFLQTIAILVTAYLAVKGIDAWKKEVVGRRKAELAEEVLALFYKMQDMIGWARFPGSYAHEGKTRPPVEGEKPEEARLRESYYVAVERLTEDSSFYADLQAAKYRFMACFGADSKKPFDAMKQIRTKIMLSAHALARGDKLSNEQKEQMEGDIGWVLGDEDKIGEQIEETIREIEAICRPCLEEKKS